MKVQKIENMQSTQMQREFETPVVSVIPATKRSVQRGGKLKEYENIRVAAYCRVSTGDESQHTSYANQKAFYQSMITDQTGWQFAGIYADEAISGTSRTRRVEFNRMIDDALDGKLDYIVTKSISRFARNTVDTLNCVRQLREQNPPVGIYFEKENIDTLDAAGELILTILSALAQDESRSISDNIRWTLQKKFQAGIPQINLKRMLGYDKGESGEWVINSEQAKTVRYIFERFVCGQSANQIAKELNNCGLMTVNGNRWTAGTVLVVLRNEKYVGDLEMQKTITKDFLTHRSVLNRGEAPKYYVRNHHAAIIDRMVWEKTQMLLMDRKKNSEKEKNKKRGQKGSPFVNLRCGFIVDGRECGERFFRMTYSGVAVGYTDERSLVAQGIDESEYLEQYVYAYPIWRCQRKRGEKSARREEQRERCPSALLHECAIEQSFMEMLYHLKRDYEDNGEESRIAALFREAYNKIYDETKGTRYSVQRMEVLDMQIQDISNQLQKTIGKQVQAMHEMEIKQNKETQQRIMKREHREIYADLTNNLRYRLQELEQERHILESDQRATLIFKKNFDFFLECLMELPEKNAAGMKLNVNRIDVEGSIFRDVEGKARNGVRGSVNSGHLKVTPEMVQNSPDYLHFERGIYLAFIQHATVYGDEIEYETNFGVKLSCTGNTRTLGSFLGFRKCEGNMVRLLMNPWEVNGKRMQYRRKKRETKQKDRKNFTDVKENKKI